MTTGRDISSDTFVITRVFNTPRQAVWDAWTKPEQFAQWFGPKGTATTVKTQDLRPGGILHSSLDSPDGGKLWAKFVYREVRAPSRLVWVHSFSDENANVTRAPFFDGNWPLELLTTVTFADEGTGTRVTLTWTPLNATEVEGQTFADNMTSMNQGWSGTFEKLDAFLAGVQG
jgi:uncharacterized protein YndB with AHSA1/START domain